MSRIFFKWSFLLLIFGVVVFVSETYKRQSHAKEYRDSPLLALPTCEVDSVYGGKKFLCSELLAKRAGLIVHFWSTSCPSCVVELPQLIDHSNKLKRKNIETLYISSLDKRSDIISFFKKRGIETRALLISMDQTGSAMKSFGTTRIPETYLFGKDGRLLKKFVGAREWSYKDTLSYFQEVL